MSIGNWIKANKVPILEGAGFVGIGVTAFAAYYAGKHMKKKLIEARVECNKKRKTKRIDIAWEYTKKITPVVAPAICAAAGTGLAFGLAGKFRKEQLTLVASMAASYSKALESTKQKIKEVAGEEVAKKVDQAIYQDKASKKEIPVDIEQKCIEQRDGACVDPAGFKQLFFDDFTEQYFRSTVDDIRKCERNMYKQMNSDRYGFADLETFLFQLGLPTPRCVKNLGFYQRDYMSDKHDIIDLSTSIVSPSGVPAIVMHYKPKIDSVILGDREVPEF